MDTTKPNISSLFAQLGLPADDSGIQQFIKQHRPLEKDKALSEANWWNESQREFLSEAIDSDSEWAIIVDEFDTLLREEC